MMNCNLRYLKNIKFNPLVIKTLANEGKKKYNTYYIKNNIKNCQKMIIRKMSTKSCGDCPGPKPPNPVWYIFGLYCISSYK